MSTYYYFKCKKCNRKGGFYSRQAWGWGNFNIIDSFKFLAYHTDNCGEQYIGVISEHDEDYEEDLNVEILDHYKKDSSAHFPLSNDWEFMRENYDESVEECNTKWIEEQTRGIKPDNGIKLRGTITEIEYEKKGRGGYVYKVFLISEDGMEYTIVNHGSTLPIKGEKYFILGETATYPSNVSIGEIRGSIIQVDDMRLIEGPPINVMI